MTAPANAATVSVLPDAELLPQAHDLRPLRLITCGSVDYGK